METVTLKASQRNKSGKGVSRRLRAEGLMPAVAYGRGSDTANVSIPQDALRSILLSERGRNTIIDLAVEGADPFQVMVKEYTVHPLSRRLLHADFLRIDSSQKVEAKVPFATIGKSKGVAIGGTLLVHVRKLHVRCLPAEIPLRVEFDVSELEIHDVVKVSELTLPEGVEVLMEADRKLLVVAPPRVILEEDEETEGEEGEEAAADGEAKEAADS